MRINNNLMAMNAYRQLGITNSAGAKAMEKLSSGLRINRAGDDAAGLAISEKMRGQIRGLTQASRNAQDGISLIQTAEGALNETHAILQRMRELAVQAATDTNTDIDRGEIQKEINQLIDEINRIAEQTQFNQQEILNGDFSGKKFHIGANSDQSIVIDISDMRAAALGLGGGTVPAKEASVTIQGITFTAVTAGAAGNNIQIEFVDPGDSDQELSISVDTNKITVNLGTDDEGNIISTADEIVVKINEDASASALVTASGSGDTPVTTVTATNLANGADATVSTGIDVTSPGNADTAITTIQSAIEDVSAERAKLGAYQNRLEHTIRNLDTSAENLQASESRIRDIDMAKEMMEFTKNNILQQAATAMLAQANMAPSGVLQLLR